jgi:glucosamine 6-phosphate synthetase-like amidotransferase/phosphosugar isomerase protein
VFALTDHDTTDGLIEAQQEANKQNIKLVHGVEISAMWSNMTIVNGTIGIAHTRWATHGKPSTKNAHPHICNDSVGVVHNGIIENFT